MDIAAERLWNQRLVRSDFRDPSAVVSWLGAVQAQEYAEAKWALGLRASELDDAAVEQAFAEGRILRTHILRPTWHFVTPADIRWMLAISGPRVNTTIASYYRKLGLDERTFSLSRRVLETALRDRAHRTRRELAANFLDAGIALEGQRLAFLMMRAELDGVVCSGPRRGKQFTYALLDERVPTARRLTREEALAELTTRYFSSHGPATLRDFVWWSGLTVREARAGIDTAGSVLGRADTDGRTYWFAHARRTGRRKSSTLHLLPVYDEFAIAYRDRDSFMDRAASSRIAVRVEFPNMLVIDGRLRGTWKRIAGARGVRILLRPFRQLSTDDRRRLDRQVRRYGRFVGLPAEIDLV